MGSIRAVRRVVFVVVLIVAAVAGGIVGACAPFGGVSTTRDPEAGADAVADAVTDGITDAAADVRMPDDAAADGPSSGILLVDELEALGDCARWETGAAKIDPASPGALGSAGACRLCSTGNTEGFARRTVLLRGKGTYTYEAQVQEDGTKPAGRWKLRLYARYDGGEDLILDDNGPLTSTWSTARTNKATTHEISSGEVYVWLPVISDGGQVCLLFDHVSLAYTP